MIIWIIQKFRCRAHDVQQEVPPSRLFSSYCTCVCVELHPVTAATKRSTPRPRAGSGSLQTMRTCRRQLVVGGGTVVIKSLTRVLCPVIYSALFSQSYYEDHVENSGKLSLYSGINAKVHLVSKSRCSVVGIETSYGLNGRGDCSSSPVWSIIFTSPCRPDRLWGPLSLLSNG
jgi:hypothetical protein